MFEQIGDGMRLLLSVHVSPLSSLFFTSAPGYGTRGQRTQGRSEQSLSLNYTLSVHDADSEFNQANYEQKLQYTNNSFQTSSFIIILTCTDGRNDSHLIAGFYNPLGILLQVYILQVDGDHTSTQHLLRDTRILLLQTLIQL